MSFLSVSVSGAGQLRCSMLSSGRAPQSLARKVVSSPGSWMRRSLFMASTSRFLAYRRVGSMPGAEVRVAVLRPSSTWFVRGDTSPSRTSCRMRTKSSSFCRNTRRRTTTRFTASRHACVWNAKQTEGTLPSPTGGSWKKSPSKTQ